MVEVEACKELLKKGLLKKNKGVRVGRRTQTRTDAHRRETDARQTRADAHRRTQTHTDAHRREQMHTDASRRIK